MRTLFSTLMVTALVSACSTPAPAPVDAPEEAAPKAEEQATADKATAEEAATKTAEVGQPAPDFTLTDLDGKEHHLADYKGKTVVLEWFNPGCPFVVAAHEDGPLKDMAKTYMDKDVVWLAVNSGAPGKQGHGAETNKEAVAGWGMPNPVLLDESGEVGHLYDAKTTPHMYVIDAEGVLQYAGGLDNAPRNAVPKVGYVAHTQNALDAVLAGEPVSTSKTQAWGCSVKYGS